MISISRIQTSPFGVQRQATLLSSWSSSSGPVGWMSVAELRKSARVIMRRVLEIFSNITRKAENRINAQTTNVCRQKAHTERGDPPSRGGGVRPPTPNNKRMWRRRRIHLSICLLLLLIIVTGKGSSCSATSFSGSHLPVKRQLLGTKKSQTTSLRKFLEVPSRVRSLYLLRSCETLRRKASLRW